MLFKYPKNSYLWSWLVMLRLPYAMSNICGQECLFQTKNHADGCISKKSKFGANFLGSNIASVLFKLLFASLQTMSQNTKLDFQLWFIWHNLNSFEKVPDITFYRLKLSALISSSRKIAFPANLISSYYNFHGMYQIRITNPSWWTIICVCHLPLQWNCMYFPTSETHLSFYPGPVCLVL